MNHYETVFILNRFIWCSGKGNSKQIWRFLLLEEPKWYRKRLGPKKWLTKSKIKKVVLSFIRIQSTRRSSYCFETEFRRDERIMRFLTVSLDKHAILGWKKKKKLKSQKRNIMATTICFRKKKTGYQISYVLNIETNKTKKYCRLKNQASNISITRGDFLLKFVNEQGKFFLVVWLELH
jgi:small subunit ribosomal protein S6